MEFVPLTRLRGWIYSNPEFSKADEYVLSRYFESESFFARSWDIYHYEGTSLDYFIPLSQATSFLGFVASETGILKSLVNIPSSCLLHRLDPGEEPPQFLQTTASKSDYDQLASASVWDGEDIPGVSVYVPKPEAKKNPIDQRAKEVKAKKKAKKRKQTMTLNRTQVRNMRRYFNFGTTANVDGTEESGDDEMQYVSWERDGTPPILVSLDVEAYEHNHSYVTEIGISTLDTSLIPAGSTSDDIIRMIKYHHYRINEYKSLRNGLFINDAADRFEFGDSTFISLAETPKRIAEHFRVGPERRVVVVGHDVKADIDYLRVVGYNVRNIRDLEVIDTANMWKAISRDPNGRGLSTVLLELDIEFWNLHNAGNDAAYTLQAAIKIAEMGVSTKGAKKEAKKSVFLNPNEFVIGVVKKSEEV
ncbi:hypothetical protein RUND412_003207 [Rhizina undulata]